MLCWYKAKTPAACLHLGSMNWCLGSCLAFGSGLEAQGLSFRVKPGMESSGHQGCRKVLEDEKAEQHSANVIVAIHVRTVRPCEVWTTLGDKSSSHTGNRQASRHPELGSARST